MNLIKTTILLVLISVAEIKVIAQANNTDVALMNKYWNYRDNFRKSFVRVGNNVGNSLPAASSNNRWKEQDGSWSYMTLFCDSFKINPDFSFEKSAGRPKKATPEFCVF